LGKRLLQCKSNPYLEVTLNSPAPFFSANRPYDEVLPWLRQRLSQAGLRVMQTFDLNTARLDLEDCPCPQHGTDKCDCQMIVLLVYGKDSGPATLILHGNDGQTWLSLIHTPAQKADSSIRASIGHALQANPSKEGL
jgi:hypothetical protein